ARARLRASCGRGIPVTVVTPLHLAGILAADGDPQALEFLRLGLPACGFRVWTAADPAEALDLLHRHKGDIDAVVLGAHLPGSSGRALLARLREEWGDLPAVFVAALCGLDRPGLDAAPLLLKPFSIAELTCLVLREMDRKDHRCGGG